MNGNFETETDMCTHTRTYRHANPFAFTTEYHAAEGISKWRIGTPPVLQMAVLESSLDVFQHVTMAEVRTRSKELSQQFIDGVESRCKELVMASPRDPDARGSQVSFRHDESYAIMQCLISRGVVGDFRAPDMMRFGFTPLYVDSNDIQQAIDILADIMDKGEWDREHFKQKLFVT